MIPNTVRIATLTAAILLGLAGTHAHAAGTGSFVGASNHVTEGMVTVTKNADGTATVTLHSDFWFDGAPDPRVGFGNDGRYTDGTDISLLKSNSGEQSFVVPASIDVDNFNEVYIWCKRFAVPLGVASLK